MSQSFDPDQVEEEIRAFCAKMSEHTESVRVFVTMPINGMTGAMSRGHGNFYAQYGQVSEWVEKCRSETQAQEIGLAIRGDGDEEN